VRGKTTFLASHNADTNTDAQYAYGQDQSTCIDVHMPLSDVLPT